MGDRLLTAADLAADTQLALVVNPDQRLDTEQAADHGRGLAQAAAAVQVAEVVHRDQMDDMQAHLFNRRGCHLRRAAAVAHLARLVHQKILAAGRGKRVHAEDLAIRVLRGELVARHAARVERAGQAGGKTDIQDILPCVERFAEELDKGIQLCLRGGRQLPLAQQIVKLMEGYGLPAVLLNGAVVDRKSERRTFDVVLFKVRRGLVDRGVSDQGKGVHGMLLSVLLSR